MEALIAAVAGACLFFLVLGVAGLAASRTASGKSRTRRRVRDLGASCPGRVDIERHRALSDLPWLHRALTPMAWAGRLDRTLRQARSDMTVGVFVLVCLALGSAAFAAGRLLMSGPAWPPVAALAAALAPVLWLRRRRNRCMAAFGRQLPEALDLVARALKAGHAFTQGLRMVADEMEDPLGGEFALLLEEINFGLPMDAALLGLTRRVDCPDLAFFVVSVNIQRDTGGNLSEIVSTIARLVRERFRLQGQVRVLSAEARLSAYVLLALPVAIALVIRLVNPQYMSRLTDTPPGRAMIYGAVALMVAGALAIRRLIAIRV